MMDLPPRIVLASASPRRHELLRGAGIAFEIRPADVDETIRYDLAAGEVARDLALRKATFVRDHLRRELPDGEPVAIIGSDTLVVLGEDSDPRRRFLEKAADAEEATAMLEALSGSRHRVVTGVAVAMLNVPSGDLQLADHETTFVSMRELSANEIADYVASGEWIGKAGSYAIQENADRFVTGLEGGGFDNVVGLPVERTLDLLRRALAGSRERHPLAKPGPDPMPPRE